MTEKPRVCRDCGVAKPLDGYYRYPGGKPFASCKECRVAYQRAYNLRPEVREWRRAQARSVRPAKPAVPSEV